MAAYGLSDADLWDLVKFSLDGVIDTRQYVGRCSTTSQPCDVSGDCPGGETCEPARFIGSDLFGSIWYSEACASCHDPSDGIGGVGTGINFGSDTNPQYVGTIAVENPWEFLHKIRFGHPGSPMPSMDLLGYSAQSAADLGAYAATLPTE
jgi:thiosulfate dehydrogenase